MSATFRAFDVHAHFAATVSGAVEQIRMMDRAGITAGALMIDFNYEWPNGIVDTRRVNDLLAARRNASSQRFPVALGTVEPFHGVEACLTEIERTTSELHLDGLVWDHHAQGTAVDEPRMVRFVKALAERGLPAFVHVDPLDMREGPVRVESLARQVPEATIVALGALSPLAQHTWELRRIADACPKLLFDTTVTSPIGRIEQYVEAIGAHRLVFGTDMYTDPLRMFERPPILDQVLTSSMLTDNDKRAILWDNALGLFPALDNVA